MAEKEENGYEVDAASLINTYKDEFIKSEDARLNLKSSLAHYKTENEELRKILDEYKDKFGTLPAKKDGE